MPATYQLTIERSFRASHAIVMGSERETPHTHDWRVEVTVAGPRLDADGLLCDFHLLETGLDEVIGVFDDSDLNRTPPFDHVNPTAERVAAHVGDRLGDRLSGRMPSGAHLVCVSVTEAPGCVATWVADPSDGPGAEQETAR